MALPSAPRVLEVVDALLDLLSAKGALPDVQVLDGPGLGHQHLSNETMIVGLTDGPDAPGYSSTLTRQQELGRTRYREDFVIRCCVSIWEGSTDLVDRRARARAIVARLHDLLARSRLLGGAVEGLVFGSDFEYVPVQAEDGAAMTLVFSITGRMLL